MHVQRCYTKIILAARLSQIHQIKKTNYLLMHQLRQKEGSVKLRAEYDICFTLCQALPPEDYDKIMRVTDTSKGMNTKRVNVL